MTNDETFSICERCHQVVEPDAPDVLAAVTLLKADTFGQPRQFIEGLDVFFHRRCWVSSDRYRLKAA